MKHGRSGCRTSQAVSTSRSSGATSSTRSPGSIKRQRHRPTRSSTVATAPGSTLVSTPARYATPRSDLCLLRGNRTGVDGTPWKLAGFLRGSDKRLLSAIPKHPKLAHYYDDPAVLIYDRRRELHIGVDHILEDNLDRFPEFCRRIHLARTVLHQSKRTRNSGSTGTLRQRFRSSTPCAEVSSNPRITTCPRAATSRRTVRPGRSGRRQRSGTSTRSRSPISRRARAGLPMPRTRF